MNSITKTQKKSKPELKIEYSRGDDGAPVLVSITDARGRCSDYWCERIPSDWGVALCMRKMWDGRAKDFGQETYDVCLDLVSWVHECDCPHYARTGENCRHIRAAIKLLDDGVLTLPPRPIVERREPEYVEEMPDSYCSTCGCQQAAHVAGFCPA